jgi:pimeloyl-ACP methyl ester carboxylesterase
MRGAEATGHGRGVVLLHSSLSSRAQWKRLVPQLERGHRVLAVDLLGYGEAPAVADAARYRVADEAARVLELADAAFGRGAPFHLVGHSYGGLAALRLAREHPGRVSGLALFEPVSFNLVPARDPDLRLLRQVAGAVGMHVRAGRHFEATRLFYDYWNGPHAFSQVPAAAQGRLMSAIAKVPLEFEAAFREAADPAHYAAITAPTLLMGGTQSPRLTRLIVETLARAIPGAALSWVEGGHMAPLAQPEQFHLMLGAFLDWTAPLPKAA